MCAALIAMTWRSEPAAATWRQVALFGCAGLWFGPTSLAGSGRGWRPSRPAGFHTGMSSTGQGTGISAADIYRGSLTR